MLTSAEYFAQYWGDVAVVSDLYDSIQQSRQAAASEESPSRNTRGYKAHLSAHTLEQALNSGTAVQVCNTPYPSKCALPWSRVAADKHKTQCISSFGCKLQNEPFTSEEVHTAVEALESNLVCVHFTVVA